jgi:oligoribonuclease (3'-5' exoribonuclease)
MPTANTDRLVWIDLETFGLKAATDPVLEIGFRITDLDLNVVDDFQCVIWESPWFDRDMLAMWYPKIDDLCSYRVIDVSSIKELCARYNPTVYARLDAETNPAKKHRVLPDMNDTINEFRFYRDNFLIAQ